MSDTHFLFEVLLLLALAAAGLALFERLRLPAIAGFLVVGAIAGPGVLGLVQEPERVSALAEFGVVFLLFEIGLELPLERLRELWRTALVAGGVQVGLTLLSVTLGAQLLGLSLGASLVLGGVVAMSSTALATRLLVDRGTVDAPQGRLAVAILIFQDLAIVPFLLAIPLFGEAGGSVQDIAWAIARMAVALGAMLLVVRGLVPRLLDRAARLRSPDLFSLLALVVVLGSAAVAEELGLTLAVGAFLAGVAATASPYSHQLFSEVVPLRGVLIGLFFTAVGMLFEPAALIDQAPAVLAYLVAAVLVKSAIVAVFAGRLTRFGSRAGVLAGAALAQTGEFSFVLAETARSAGLIDPDLHQVIIAGSILSLLLTPFLVRAAPALSDRLLGRRESAPPTGDGEPGSGEGEAEGGVIVIGFGHAGQTLVRTLRSVDVRYAVIDANASSVEAARERGEPIVFGDATRPAVLHRCGIERARLVVVAISDPLATRRIVSRIHATSPGTPILARTRYVKEVDLLDDAGASMVIAEEYEGALELVAKTLSLFSIPTAAIRNFTDAMRDEGYGAIRTNAALPIDPWLIELLDEVETCWVEVPEHFEGEASLLELGVRARTGTSVLAVERGGARMPNPPPSEALSAGDRLLVLGDQTGLRKLEALLGSASAGDEGPSSS